MGKIRDLFKKIRDTKGTFYAKMSTIKDRNGMDLTEAEEKVMAPHSSTLAWKIPWTEGRDIVQDRDQDHPQEKQMQKSKMVV